MKKIRIIKNFNSFGFIEICVPRRIVLLLADWYIDSSWAANG